MRICLIGLPRCGSQYISRLVKNVSTKIVILDEPFTVATGITCIQYINGQVKLTRDLKFDSIQDQIDHVIYTLSQAPDQSCVLKLFLLDYLEPYLAQIVDALTKLNFKFIVMTRENRIEQLLSFGIALETDRWNSYQGIYQQGYKTQITHFESMQWLNDQIINFNRRLSNLKIDPLGIVRYEYAVEDLSKILEIPINPLTELQKQITSDPYDLIENAEEVNNFIKTLPDGTQIH